MRKAALRMYVIAVMGIIMNWSFTAYPATRECLPGGDFEKLDGKGQPVISFGSLQPGNSFEMDGVNHILKLTPKKKQVFNWTPPAGTIKAGEDYFFTFKIKGNKLQGFRMCLWTQLPDKHEPPNGPIFSQTYTGTFDWKSGKVKFKMPKGITRLTLFLDFSAIKVPGEAAMLDDLSVRPVDAPAEFTTLKANPNLKISRECLPNGDFEDIGEDGISRSPWGKLKAGNTFELEGANTVLKITPRNKQVFEWQPGPGIIEGGKDYIFSYRFKGKDLKRFRFCLWTRLPDKHEPPNGPLFSGWSTGTFDWKSGEIRFKMPEGITRFIIFFDGIQQGGTLYMDDLSIRPADAPATVGKIDPKQLPSYRGLVTEHDIFMFPHGSRGHFEFKLLNRRESSCPIKAVFAFGLHGKEAIKTDERIVKLPASSLTKVPYELEAAKFPYGVYDISIRFLDIETNKEFARTVVSVGICSDKKLRKAKDGEFLYGLDASLRAAFRQEIKLKWAEYMGADIIRGGFETWEDRGKKSGDLMNMLRKGMPIYKKYHMQVMLNVDPPVPGEHGDWMLPYEQLLAKRIKFVETAAKAYPEVKFWELGNEPDIGFYKGPKEQYAADFVKLYKAIKRGNKNTVVMNGGFAYDRANILTILKNIPNDCIDVIAYHGHGPGVGAERSAYLINRQLADAAGKADKLLTETESGMDARTYEQEETQAATVIQKMVFAQSKKEPLFMWFRLWFEHPNQYNTLKHEDKRQPRPAVLSYRALVETLRGSSFSHLIDVGKESAEGYAFNEINGNKRAAVFWVNTKMSYGIFLKAGTQAGKVSDAKLVDMYGNAKNIPVLADGRINLDIDNHPRFVTWTTSEPEFKAQIGHSDLEIAPVAEIPVGGSFSTEISLHNSGTAPIKPEVKWVVESQQPVTIAMKQDNAAIAAGEKRSQTVTLSLDKWKENNDWPKEWRVFTFVKPGVNPGSFSSVPETLPGGNGKIKGRNVFLVKNKIDLAKVGGGFREKAVAILFAELYSDRAQKVKVGGAADYWMDWYVNGKRVYDTLTTGNGAGYYVHSHKIDIPLKKGKNLIAIKVLSGSQGWRLVAGGPRDLQQALKGETDKVRFSLYDGTRKIAEESVILKFIHPVPLLAGGFSSMNDELLSKEEPSGYLAGDSILNLFFKEPDTKKWWQGEHDLSAMVWLRQNSGKLLVAVEVEDDVHVPPASSADIGKHDSLEIAISDGSKTAPQFFEIGDVKGKTVARSRDGSLVLKANFKRVGKHSFYFVEIPWNKLVAAKEGFFNLRINDNDQGYLKQHAVWKPGFEKPSTPVKWHRIIMPSANHEMLIGKGNNVKNNLFEIAIVGKQDVFWQYRSVANGNVVSAAAPVFEIDGQEMAIAAGAPKDKPTITDQMYESSD